MYHWQAQSLRRNFRLIKNEIERYKHDKDMLVLFQKLLIENIRVITKPRKARKKKLVLVPDSTPSNLIKACDTYIKQLDTMMKVKGKDFIFIEED